jgi:hypothetical protein
MIFTGLKQIVKDIRYMLGFGLGIYWKFTWCFLIPIALAVIFIYAVSIQKLIVTPGIKFILLSLQMIVYEPLKTDDGEPYPPAANGKYNLSCCVTVVRLTFILT